MIKIHGLVLKLILSFSGPVDWIYNPLYFVLISNFCMTCQRYYKKVLILHKYSLHFLYISINLKKKHTYTVHVKL